MKIAILLILNIAFINPNCVLSQGGTCRDAVEDCSGYKKQLKQTPMIIGGEKELKKVLIDNKQYLMAFNNDDGYISKYDYNPSNSFLSIPVFMRYKYCLINNNVSMYDLHYKIDINGVMIQKKTPDDGYKDILLSKLVRYFFDSGSLKWSPARNMDNRKIDIDISVNIYIHTDYIGYSLQTAGSYECDDREIISGKLYW